MLKEDAYMEIYIMGLCKHTWNCMHMTEYYWSHDDEEIVSEDDISDDDDGNADSIRVMWDKLTPRDTMKNAGVPTVPRSDGLLQH
ncbi:putative ligase [Helianthus annuus]|nr:putative ligase [Helianthus annuus]KAJ0449507.1 putative ligase [Helianthus annuus]KAJ0634361.1 putative ligase [Helianthus annuus]